MSLAQNALQRLREAHAGLAVVMDAFSVILAAGATTPLPGHHPTLQEAREATVAARKSLEEASKRLHAIA